MIQNLHTHSLFSDGENSIYDLALEAISKGFSSFGISDHSYLLGEEDWCMASDDLSKYLDEIKKVNDKLGDKIKTYQGIELDFLSEDPKERLDYIIGSSHFVCLGEKAFCIDNTPEDFKKAVDAFGGINELLESYYSQLLGWAKRDCDIIGHFDIPEKFKKIAPELYFGIDTERVFSQKKKTAEALVKAGKIFEINTAGIEKRDEVYPSEEVLKLLYDLGAKITVSSDCHKKELLDAGFSEALSLAKKVGFKEIYILSGGKFIPQKI